MIRLVHVQHMSLEIFSFIVDLCCFVISVVLFGCAIVVVNAFVVFLCRD